MKFILVFNSFVFYAYEFSFYESVYVYYKK